MTIAVVGLNYRTAPVELREQLTLSGCALSMALAELRDLAAPAPGANGAAYAAPLCNEAVILSTCNRLEVYISTAQAGGGTAHAQAAAAQIGSFLARLQNIPATTLAPHLYSHTSDGAIAHLMEVACGLDSMILGESQILGQVTQAYEDAHAAGMTGPILSHLFAQAIHAGKRARTETAISRNTTSVSHAGALLLMEKLTQPLAARVLIIGAGEMAILAAQALKRFGFGNLAFINRTYTRAEALAQDFGGSALTWYQLQEALLSADAIVCATGAPHIVIYRNELEAVLEQRSGGPLVIMDIAVPRDVEESVRELAGVQLYDIDDLQSVVDTNVELRRAAVPEVSAVIRQEMARFGEWYHGREVMPVIKTLRERAQSIADDELEQTLARMGDIDERTRRLVSRMAHRLVNRLLHEPTARLRIQANEGNGHGYAYAVRELFALDEVEVVACDGDSAACALSENAANGTLHCNLQCILPPTPVRAP